MKTLETFVETLLWNSRLIMIVPVALSVILALGVLLVNLVDSINLVGDFLSYLNPALEAEARDTLRLETLARVVGVIDGYLISAILFIFGMGLYELFVNKIDMLEGSDFAKRVLLIRNLDDLKDKLVNTVVLILVVKFFQIALELKYKTALDLLSLAVGIALLGAALYLTGRVNAMKKEKADKPADAKG